MRDNVDFNYPSDLFDNLEWLYINRSIEVPDIKKWNIGMEPPMVERRQYVFHFSNGFGASVIKGPGTYGYEKDLWELAVLSEYRGEWHLEYGTDITDDVIGYLSVEEVKNLLEKIRGLKCD